MTIAVRPLAGLDDLRACEALQQAILGDSSRRLLRIPALASIERSGGLLLGAWDDEEGRPALKGALVDLVAETEGFSARFTIFLGVHADAVNRGVGQALRRAERSACAEAGAGLVFWWADPLRSREAHIAFNKLGAIASAHRRNALGPLRDSSSVGLASDRIRVEWWLDAPRVRAVLEEDRPPPHFDLGLHQMHVLTETRRAPSGERLVVGLDAEPTKPHVLVEIPVDLDRVRRVDLEAARRWRLVTREAFEVLFAHGYVLVGLVHEGGRSFHLLERADRGDVLGRS